MVEDIIKSVMQASSLSPRPKEQGVKLEVPKHAKYVDFDDDAVRLWKKPKRSDKPTEDWVTGDFVSYARWLHFSRYNQDWDLNFRGACVEALRVRDAIVDTYGFCDNLVFRDFIEYFFGTFADNYIRRSKRFLFVQMMDDKILDRFSKDYNYRTRIEADETHEDFSVKKIDRSVNFSEDAVRQSYLLSVRRAVSDYGVIIAVNFAHVRLGKKPSEAARAVFEECVAIRNKTGAAGLRKVAETTKSFGPYPRWLPFLGGSKLIQKLEPTLVAEADLCDDDFRFDFLKPDK